MSNGFDNIDDFGESRRNRPDRDRPECEKPRPPHPPQPKVQTHVHEVQGSVMLAEECDDRHNHRFATVTTDAIPLPHGDHKHGFMVNTDFFDHHHEVAGETGGAICVGQGKHVHFARGKSTINDGHFHGFQFATLIESPLL